MRKVLNGRHKILEAVREKRQSLSDGIIVAEFNSGARRFYGSPPSNKGDSVIMANFLFERRDNTIVSHALR